MKPRQQHFEEHSLQRDIFKNNSNNHNNNNTNNNNGGGSLFNRLPWTTKLRSSLDSLFSLLDTPIIDVSSSSSPPDFRNLSRPHPSSLSDTNPIQKKKYQSLSTPASPPQSRYHMMSSHSRSSSSSSSNLYQHTESQNSTDYQTEPNSAAVYSTSSSSSDYQLRQDNLTQELSSISQLLPELVNSLYIDPSPRFGNTIDGSAESPMRPPSPISLPTSPSTPSYSSAESPTHLAQLLADDNFDLTSSNFEAPNATLVSPKSMVSMLVALLKVQFAWILFLRRWTLLRTLPWERQAGSAAAPAAEREAFLAPSTASSTFEAFILKQLVLFKGTCVLVEQRALILISEK